MIRNFKSNLPMGPVLTILVRRSLASISVPLPFVSTRSCTLFMILSTHQYAWHARGGLELGPIMPEIGADCWFPTCRSCQTSWRPQTIVAKPTTAAVLVVRAAICATRAAAPVTLTTETSTVLYSTDDCVLQRLMEALFLCSLFSLLLPSTTYYYLSLEAIGNFRPLCTTYLLKAEAARTIHYWRQQCHFILERSFVAFTSNPLYHHGPCQLIISFHQL